MRRQLREVFEAAALGVGGGGDVETGPWGTVGTAGRAGKGGGDVDDFHHQQWGLYGDYI